MCSAVNGIDASGLESLEAINHRLADGGIQLHLSEVKGPVMDALERTHFTQELTGKVWLSQNAAFDAAISIANKGERSDLTQDPWLARGLI
jgi:SulP family sulfate permease